MALPDAFDGSSLGPDWTSPAVSDASGTPSVGSGVASGSGVSAYYATAFGSGTQTVTIIIPSAPANYNGVAAMLVDGSQNGYSLYWQPEPGGGQFFLEEYTGGTTSATIDTGFTGSYSYPLTITLERTSAGDLTGTIGGSVETTATDTTHTPTYAGFQLWGGTITEFDADPVSSGDIEGIGSGTVGALTGSGTGNIPVISGPFAVQGYAQTGFAVDIGGAPADITGTASGTIGALSGSGAGAVYITGSASGTVGALTGSGAGGVQVAGSASGTVGALSGAGVGGPVVSGAASGTIGALSGQGSGAVVVSGAAAGTIGALSGIGEGTVVGGISGAGSGTIGALSGSGVGSLTITGAATGSVGALSGAGSGALLVTGQAPAAIIGALLGTAIGSINVAGSAVGTIGALSGSGVAVVVVSGAASGSVGALTGTATGAVVASQWETATARGTIVILIPVGHVLDASPSANAQLLESPAMARVDHLRPGVSSRVDVVMVESEVTRRA